MAILAQKLNQQSTKGLSFKTRGYNKEKKYQNTAKFRLNTIVTATTNFDSEAHDLVDEGQHNNTRIGKNKPPAEHNPHTKLIFPDDAIDLHCEPHLQNGKIDPHQRYFYEFVGKDIHKSYKSTLPFTGVMFSSGGESWKKFPGILEKK